MQCLFCVYKITQCSPEVKILRRQNSQTLWSLGKSRAVRFICLFDFFDTEIRATLIEYFQMFSSLIMKKKLNIAEHR